MVLSIFCIIVDLRVVFYKILLLGSSFCGEYFLLIIVLDVVMVIGGSGGIGIDNVIGFEVSLDII